MNIYMNDKKIDLKTSKKYKFIDNALKKGWRVEYKDNNYIFTKKHGGEEKFFNENYLDVFIQEMIN